MNYEFDLLIARSCGLICPCCNTFYRLFLSNFKRHGPVFFFRHSTTHIGLCCGEQFLWIQKKRSFYEKIPRNVIEKRERERET